MAKNFGMSNFKASEIDEWAFLMDVWRELNDVLTWMSYLIGSRFPPYGVSLMMY